MDISQRKVLVLNKRWTAIGIVGLPRAISMLFSRTPCGKLKAEVIDGECNPWSWEEWALLTPAVHEECIRTAHQAFRIPEVVKLNGYERIPTPKVAFNRRSIYKRDNYTCCYCGAKPGTQELTIDHLIPRSAGGLTTWSNCLICCVECNASKSNKIPEPYTVQEKNKTIQMYKVFFSKRRKNWNTHIKEPTKPKHDFFINGIQYKSWINWIPEYYWNVELENDHN